MNTDKQIIDKLQLELNLLEENYALAFEIGSSPYVLNDIWKRIKELKATIENQKANITRGSY